MHAYTDRKFRPILFPNSKPQTPACPVYPYRSSSVESAAAATGTVTLSSPKGTSSTSAQATEMAATRRTTSAVSAGTRPKRWNQARRPRETRNPKTTKAAVPVYVVLDVVVLESVGPVSHLWMGATSGMTGFHPILIWTYLRSSWWRRRATCVPAPSAGPQCRPSRRRPPSVEGITMDRLNRSIHSYIDPTP